MSDTESVVAPLVPALPLPPPPEQPISDTTAMASPAIRTSRQFFDLIRRILLCCAVVQWLHE
jgi:hypothetical protein